MPFEIWPYTNFHDLNLDWIMKQFPLVYQARDDAQEAAEGMENIKTAAEKARDDAEAAQLAAEAAQGYAEGAANDAHNSAVDAQAAVDSALNTIGTTTAGLVADWLSTHVDPDTGYVIDDTLTVEGAAADARKTGYETSGLRDFWVQLQNPSITWEQGGIDNGTGANTTDATVIRSGFIEVPSTIAMEIAGINEDPMDPAVYVDVYRYSSNNVADYIGHVPTLDGNFVMWTDAGSYLRFTIRYQNSANIAPGDESIGITQYAPTDSDLTYAIGVTGHAADSGAVGDAIRATQSMIPGLDNTLSLTGNFAAGAKATGDAIDDLKSALESVDETVSGVISKNYTEGKNLYATATTHNIIDDPTSCISDYIPVTWGTGKVTFWYTDDTTDVTGYYIFFFDENKDFLLSYVRSPIGSQGRGNLATPDGAAYARFSFKKGFAGYLTSYGVTPVDTYYTAASTVVTPGLVQKTGDLSALETTNKSSLVGAINEVRDAVPVMPVTPQDTSFFHISKNLVDPETCVTGQFVNQVNGTFVNNASHNRTDYIRIDPQTTYVVRKASGAVGNDFRYAFYNEAKGYISGALGALGDMLLTSPANAAYIVTSENGTLPENMMIAKYLNEDKSFERYDSVYILNKYIREPMEDVILNVPEKIYALVGLETNIYFENITEKWEDYDWDVSCTKGAQYERGYKLTPAAGDVGSYTLTIKASVSETIYKEVTATLIITAADAGSGTSKSVIVLGDSTTNSGTVIEKLNANFSGDVMSITTLGTRGTSPNNHEGRSGWKWEDYFTKASITYTDGRGTVYNPFYNPTSQTFDAAYYFANSGISKPDYFIVNMGINDVFGYASDSALSSAMTTIMSRCEAAVASILEATTTTKVCVCVTIPPNRSQDAFGKAYGCAQTRDRCKRNNAIWAKALIDTFDGRESERIYVIPIHANLDTVYNMGLETLPVNARNTDVTYQSPIANGGVHPVASGYWQIADVYTAFIKGT